MVNSNAKKKPRLWNLDKSIVDISTLPMAGPSSLACTECRKHHIKCDAKRPSCSRCLDARLDCTYLPSRRGGRRKSQVHRPQPSGDLLHPPPLPQQIPIVTPGCDASVVSLGRHAQTDPAPTALDLPEIDTRLVRLFYENFHPGHPILLPSSLYEEQKYPDYLQQVVKFVGSHYSQRISGDVLRQATADQLHASSERSPSMVQALLLYSIFLCARGESAEAQAALSQAVDIALELGMYLREFATSFSKGNEMEAESLRRTWWELFIVDVDAAALQKPDHAALPWRALRCRLALRRVDLCRAWPPPAALDAGGFPQTVVRRRGGR